MTTDRANIFFCKWKAGDKALVEGPFGRFGQPDNPASPQLWIAGGIGVTPFVSLAKSLDNNSDKVFLYYCVTDSKEAAFAQILEKTARSNPHLHLIIWESQKSGRISYQPVSQQVKNLNDREIFICGPVPNEKIYTEEFSLG